MEKAGPANNYYYNHRLKPLAIQHRKRMNKAEACLWKYQLQGRQMRGYKFLRQRPVLNYIVDFMCKELMLVIEADGVTHETEDMLKQDAERDAMLKSIGFTVLRFSNWEILNRIGHVSEMIVTWIEQREQEM